MSEHLPVVILLILLDLFLFSSFLPCLWLCHNACIRCNFWLVYLTSPERSHSKGWTFDRLLAYCGRVVSFKSRPYPSRTTAPFFLYVYKCVKILPREISLTGVLKSPLLFCWSKLRGSWRLLRLLLFSYHSASGIQAGAYMCNPLRARLSELGFWAACAWMFFCTVSQDWSSNVLGNKSTVCIHVLLF